jgi:nucleoside-diphosphate kinase
VTERTLVLIKPDAMARRLAGEIIARYECKSLAVVALELRTVDDETAGALYAEHVDKPFYPGLREFITSAPVIAMVLEGDQAIDVVRLINGATDARQAAPGTIRGDLGLSKSENLVHGSDSADAAKREIAIFFPDLVDQGSGSRT